MQACFAKGMATHLKQSPDIRSASNCRSVTDFQQHSAPALHRRSIKDATRESRLVDYIHYAYTAPTGDLITIKDSIMKNFRKSLFFSGLLLLVASPIASSQDGCAFCELQFRQCVRSGTNIDLCWAQREECYVMNGCMAP